MVSGQWSFLFDLLLKGSEIIGVEKIGNRYFKSVAQLFYGRDTGVFALPVEN